MLKIDGVHTTVEGKEILRGISLTLKPGEVHAILGPNGGGKSTLAATLMGHPRHKVTAGSILLDGKDLLACKPDERAKAGLFLSFQYPREIPGVTVENFLRTAYQHLHGPIGVLPFHTLLKMAILKMDAAFARRYLNDGFSGGEKKRMEILQLLVLTPRYIIMDETDSGLDVDALKLVADAVASLRDKEHAFLIITHGNRLLSLLPPDTVHIIKDGRITETGDASLAHMIDLQGFN
jgi:Fe-S cluster assembly ATP-binding protein